MSEKTGGVQPGEIREKYSPWKTGEMLPGEIREQYSSERYTDWHRDAEISIEMLRSA